MSPGRSVSGGRRAFHVKRSAREAFRRQLDAWGVKASREQLSLLEEYALLLAGYRRANVIGTREPETVLLEHVLDSASCLLFEPLRAAGRVADVGSGGGLPGIPLKILLPEARVVLIESTGKKADFLRYAIESLGLSGVDVVNARVEAVAREAAHRSRYDAALARAVAALPVLAEYCVPLLRVGGHAVAMKGGMPEHELRLGEGAAAVLGARLSGVLEVPRLPEVGEEKRRRLVILEKRRETPGRYPRKAGVPAKRPLRGGG
ncbi:methyltransferase GidB [Rubrobacter xylanophilus DSM 9941]|uniref:Ribosomal RNA small subunit methyltransferase G n=1 Tax=Rubrobacter xylanophilus (strain DSM 9941 / JCM 11954 / NBRC 16129 / PRD-1) TaxID=266117 RepID=RSMG_RUBXD|nr:16S rRNA (guanine(527)-N(7))-methyltransferase RsmG [Rubrobacter xylanophilus]Q1AR63.1 RecName: Full=Ribosomal RNA small subunit methyltransferase G; AltName: Full=16S rRNA 7-methylguanosine methyltransferase; Short=16S rRNA m7G methyltransferase [Rubrobacter xylanophilus DSM 9941]ABG06115.1 methyltransferase GidB [Rubrobacter xylanophilus DSM 9941]